MCRSFISIIFPFTRRKLHVRRVCVSILYKYHISLPYLFKFIQTSNMCRSFISIIFPASLACEYYARQLVSILYKYHISRVGWIIFTTNLQSVSILYKYHIFLTKYSTFWTLIDKNVEK